MWSKGCFECFEWLLFSFLVFVGVVDFDYNIINNNFLIFYIIKFSLFCNFLIFKVCDI